MSSFHVNPISVEVEMVEDSTKRRNHDVSDDRFTTTAASPTTPHPEKRARHELLPPVQPSRRTRQTRWGPSNEKVSLPGLPTQLPINLGDDQARQYLRILRVDEISRKLRGDTLNPPPEFERNGSPEPVYGMDGKRANTREMRYRDKLEKERHRLVEEAIKADPLYKPPMDFKRPNKLTDKVNFMGALIGPRGSTLKKMEADTGAKLSIRGKGSAKEGRSDLKNQPGDDEELHCLVMADTEEKLEKAVQMVNEIINLSASVPEEQNDLKKQQLRDLAILNGTLRDDEGQNCSNCGAPGHSRFECPEQANVTTAMRCRLCGGLGHVETDCLQRNNPEAVRKAHERNVKMDSEYETLMASLNNSRRNPDQQLYQNQSQSLYGNGTSQASMALAGGVAPWQMSAPVPTPPPSMAPWQSAPPPPTPDYQNASFPPWQAPPPPHSQGLMPWQTSENPPPPPSINSSTAPWHQNAQLSAMPPPPPPSSGSWKQNPQPVAPWNNNS